MKSNLDEAVANFTKAVELDPANGGAEGNLGHALMATGDVEGAIPHFRKALELGPETAEYHTDLGIALAKKHQLGEAIPHFERALALAPDAVDAHYYLGKALVIEGRGAGWLPLAEHAVQLTSAGESAILGTLAAVYAKPGASTRQSNWNSARRNWPRNRAMPHWRRI